MSAPKIAPVIKTYTPEYLISSQPEIKWIVEPWVAAGGITEIIGKQKLSGKTTFVLAMCRSILTSAPFLGKRVTSGPVLYLTEQPLRSLTQALEDARVEEQTHLHLVLWADVASYDWPATARAAAAEAKKIGCVMLVVDTLPQFSLRGHDTENDAAAALEAIRPLQLAVAKLGIGIVVIRHARKGGGGITDIGRGSSAYGAAADIILTLRRSSGSNKSKRLLNGAGRFSEIPESTQIYRDGETGLYHLCGAERKIATKKAASNRAQKDLFRTKTLELFARDATVWTTKELLAKLGCAKSTLVHVLSDLVNEGTVRLLRPQRGSLAKRYTGTGGALDDAIEAISEIS